METGVGRSWYRLVCFAFSDLMDAVTIAPGLFHLPALPIAGSTEANTPPAAVRHLPPSDAPVPLNLQTLVMDVMARYQNISRQTILTFSAAAGTAVAGGAFTVLHSTIGQAIGGGVGAFVGTALLMDFLKSVATCCIINLSIDDGVPSQGAAADQPNDNRQAASRSTRISIASDSSDSSLASAPREREGSNGETLVYYGPWGHDPDIV